MATWADKDRQSPSPYDNAKARIGFWPSKLELEVDDASGRFTLGLTAFRETWVPLPGGGGLWPVDVKSDAAALPVVAHEGWPSVKVPAGTLKLTGAYRWQEILQRIRLAGEIGILSLNLNGRPVDAPAWDVQGSCG